MTNLPRLSVQRFEPLLSATPLGSLGAVQGSVVVRRDEVVGACLY